MTARVLALMFLAIVCVAGSYGTDPFLPPTIVSAASAAIGTSQCLGHTWTNEGAGGTIILDLPKASVGQRCTFVVVTAQLLTVNPNIADRFIQAGVATFADGDALQGAATIGTTVTIYAVNATRWVVTSQTGTWSDVN